jgi:hypothetical protein
VERIRRSIGWSFEFFPWAVFFPTVQAKTGLTGFPNQSDRLSPMGCHEEFFSKRVSVVLWLLLFKEGRLLRCFGGAFGKNRCDRFAKPV